MVAVAFARFEGLDQPDLESTGAATFGANSSNRLFHIDAGGNSAAVVVGSLKYLVLVNVAADVVVGATISLHLRNKMPAAAGDDPHSADSFLPSCSLQHTFRLAGAYFLVAFAVFSVVEVDSWMTTYGQFQVH